MTEEQEGILRRAERFDKLVSQDAWKEILEFAAGRVNDAIILASETEDSRDVIRWNAKRQMLDDIIHEVEGTRRERDEIRKMQIGEMNAGSIG